MKYKLCKSIGSAAKKFFDILLGLVVQRGSFKILKKFALMRILRTHAIFVVLVENIFIFHPITNFTFSEDSWTTK